MRILLVEDDYQLSNAISSSLRQSGYAVDTVGDGLAADSLLKRSEYDGLVVDLGLPALEGSQVIERVRKRRSEIPTIIITARDDVHDRVNGLDGGADDYLVKPFALAELEARLRALIRRRHFRSHAEISFENMRFDTTARRLFVKDQAVDLSAREMTLLELFIKNVGRVLSKEVILENICEHDETLGLNAIEVYLHRLRKKLEGAGVSIRTLRGLGYIFELTAVENVA